MNFIEFIFLLFAGVVSFHEIGASCPVIPFRQYDESPKRTFPICAILYLDTNCTGDHYGLGIGTSTGKNLDMPKSIRINPGCMIYVCNGKTCYSHEAGTKMLSLDKIEVRSNSSFICTCGEGSDAIDDSDSPLILHRGETPPLAFPDSEVLHTCAVMVEHFSAHGIYTWVHDGASLKSIPADWTNPGAYTYAITRPGCTLKFCTDVAFEGDCSAILPGRQTSDDDYNFFKPMSLSCSCEDNEEGPSTTSPKFSRSTRRTTTVTDNQDEDGLFPMRTSRPSRRTTTTTFDQDYDGLFFATTPRPSRSTRGVRTTAKATIQGDED